MSRVEITGIFVYPVKSMKGIPLESAQLTPLGLEHDRCWMVVRENGRFVTQREMPKMALLHTAIDDKGLSLSRDGFGSIEIPHDHTDGEAVTTKVWNDEVQTHSAGAEISHWLTSALESGTPLRLVRMAPGFTRPQSQPDLLGAGTTTVFADAAPFLVANEASLETLNRELLSRGHDTVPMNRFRPNIVVKGLEPFAEHGMKRLRGERYSLELTHPCQRCVVTTIDQETGTKHPDWQPYKTLREINPMPGNDKAPAFGQNAVLAEGPSQIAAAGQSFSTA